MSPRPISGIRPVPEFSADDVAMFHSRYAKPGGDSGCWVWSPEKPTGGYGSFRTMSRENYAAHRVSYTLEVGRIPDGLEIDHLCVHPSCVNPAHLEPVTPRENTTRGARYHSKLRRAMKPRILEKAEQLRVQSAEYWADEKVRAWILGADAPSQPLPIDVVAWALGCSLGWLHRHVHDKAWHIGSNQFLRREEIDELKCISPRRDEIDELDVLNVEQTAEELWRTTSTIVSRVKRGTAPFPIPGTHPPMFRRSEVEALWRNDVYPYVEPMLSSIRDHQIKQALDKCESFTTSTAARVLGADIHTVFHYIDAGDLPVLSINGLDQRVMSWDVDELRRSRARSAA